MKNTIRNFGAAALAAASFSALAATQGSIGSGPDAESQGSFDITLRVAQQIVVKNFQDLPLLTTNGAANGQPIEGAESFCVGGIGFPNFSVELSSGASSTAGEYYLSDGTNLLQYNVSFANTDTATTLADGTEPTATTNSIPGTFSNFDNLGCNTDNSTVVVSIPALSWESAAVAGDYTDTLTVLVTAN